ncbi:MAG TPA: prolipoprotein diacylglyceryl transferase, partial [Hyphomonadaceae bacterium]|nr:prolipoprotein diacylglyceryl transferase [Hyphomonadaceae bacterium]
MRPMVHTGCARMIEAAIQFPQIDPAALSIPHLFDLGPLHVGPFPLRWYALAYIVGLLLGWRWMTYLIRRQQLWTPGKPSVSVPQADDFLFWATLGVILGGRIGYILFYMLPVAAERAKIAADPLAMLRIWEGGMAFHGGLIGVGLAVFFFAYKLDVKLRPRVEINLTQRRHVNYEQYTKLASKHAASTLPEGKKREYARFGSNQWILKAEAKTALEKAKVDKVGMLALGDLAAAAAPIGLFFGRIANFINGELWGRHTDAPWGVVFPEGGYNWVERAWVSYGNETARHPSQLYEAALEGVALFVIVNLATFRFQSLARPGFNTGLFLICYGVFRFLLEFVREPDAHMPEALQGYVTMGMLLSAPMIAAGAWLLRRALV